MSDATKFPESRWAEMRECMETGGARALIDLVGAESDPARRLQLHAFGRMALASRDWKGKNFDDQVSFVRAGCAEARRQADAASGADQRIKLEDWENVLSYNHAADLCECWPGDTLARERRHFEAGRDAALRCIELRTKLGKGPGPFAIAYWALGMHQLSLGEPTAAAASFSKALDCSREVARAGKINEAITAGGDYQIILNTAFRALALALAGQPDALVTFRACKAAFAATDAGYPEQREDAQFGLDTLDVVEARFLEGSAGGSGPVQAQAADRDSSQPVGARH